MKLFSRWIDEMPMMAVDSLTLRRRGVDVAKPFGLIGVAHQGPCG